MFYKLEYQVFGSDGELQSILIEADDFDDSLRKAKDVIGPECVLLSTYPQPDLVRIGYQYTIRGQDRPTNFTLIVDCKREVVVRITRDDAVLLEPAEELILRDSIELHPNMCGWKNLIEQHEARRDDGPLLAGVGDGTEAGDREVPGVADDTGGQ